MKQNIVWFGNDKHGIFEILNDRILVLGCSLLQKTGVFWVTTKASGASGCWKNSIHRSIGINLRSVSGRCTLFSVQLAWQDRWEGMHVYTKSLLHSFLTDICLLSAFSNSRIVRSLFPFKGTYATHISSHRSLCRSKVDHSYKSLLLNYTYCSKFPAVVCFTCIAL